MSEPPENENATGKGGALETDYDDGSVADSYVSRQDAMNREYVRACRAAGIEPDLPGRAIPREFSTLPALESGFENGSAVHVVREANLVAMTAEQALLRTISHACQWSNGCPIRWAAFLMVGGYDGRPIPEVAASLDKSPRLLQMRVKEARAWLNELRAELEAS